MIDDDIKIMHERIGALDQKINAAHTRQDRMEDEIKDLLKELSKEMKDVTAFVNRSKGWGAAAVLLATLVGGIIAKLLIK